MSRKEKQNVETHEPKGELREGALGRSAAAVAARLVDVASTGGTQIGIHSLFLHHVDGALAWLGITHLLRSETLMRLGRDGLGILLQRIQRERIARELRLFWWNDLVETDQSDVGKGEQTEHLGVLSGDGQINVS